MLPFRCGGPARIRRDGTPPQSRMLGRREVHWRHPQDSDWNDSAHDNQNIMKRIWTIIGVGDVHQSTAWYQSLFGQPRMPPVHDHFGQIVDTDGTVLLCLHRWGAHEHPSLTSASEAKPGNGLLLFFRVDEFEMTLVRARELVDRFDEEPHVNANTRTREFSLRDPDGYFVTISALD